MLIEYVANRMRRDVRDAVGNALIARKIARGVYDTREMSPELAPKAADDAVPEEVTTTRKRKYRRRDIQASE